MVAVDETQHLRHPPGREDARHQHDQQRRETGRSQRQGDHGQSRTSG